MRFKDPHTGFKKGLRPSALCRKMLPGIPAPENARGFTLIEVLIAMAIFAIGVLAVTSMQMRSINLNTTARLQTEAATLAVGWMERLLALPFDDADGDGCLDTGYFTQDYFDDDGVAAVEGARAGAYAQACENKAANFLKAQGGEYAMKWWVNDSAVLPNRIKEIHIRISHVHRHAKTVRLSSFKGQDEQLPEP